MLLIPVVRPRFRRPLRFLAALAVALLNWPAAAQEWVSLFDGRTTAGWLRIDGQPVPATWAVVDGCLKSLPQAHAWQDIRTAEEFDDFELEFEWKIAPGGNGGVKYLIERVDRWASRNGPGEHIRARGLEYQIIDAQAEDARRGPERTTAALYGKIAPEGAECRPPGEFNQSRIVLRQGTVEHWLNGRLVLKASGQPVRRSPISLQHHNSEVWFRAVRIRRLPPE